MSSSSSSTVITTSSSQIEIDSAPTDGITALQFSPLESNRLLLCSSWDSTLRLYDTENNNLIASSDLGSPALDCCWSSDGQLSYVTCLNGTICIIDWTAGCSSLLGTHQNSAARSVSVHQETDAVVTSSWNGTVQVHDPRSDNPLMVTDQRKGFKCLSQAVSDGGYELVVAGTQRAMFLYDLRYMQVQIRESSLMDQTRCVKIIPRAFAPHHASSLGFTLASIEGRISCQYFEEDKYSVHNTLVHSYAFKCHRQPIKTGKMSIAHPVNALAYHPKQGTFASGGGDGQVSIWDGFAKKRVCLYKPYDTSISALSFSADGQRLAVAASYAYEYGELPPQTSSTLKDRIFVRRVNDVEVRPKAIAKAL